MNVERSLQIAVATVAALGACLLSMEQQTTILALVAVAASMTSVYVTDRQGWVDLPRWFSNLVALVALVMTLAQITQIADGLLALANLLVYLQIVLLFQKKEERDYWQIIALSLLQVVVAAALNLSMLFGIMLGFYFFAALAAMTLLFLFREGRRGARNVAADLPAIRRPLSGNHDVMNPPRGTDCWWRVLNIGLQTLLLTVFVFFALPRLRGQDENPATAQALATTGMSSEVSLDSMEEILENPETVLRISLVDPITSKPFEFMGELYLHGTVLIEYAGYGHWRYQRDTTDLPPLHDPPTGAATVRQDIDLEPGRHPYLLSIAPAYRSATRQPKLELGLDRFSHQLGIKDRERSEFRERFRYSLATTAIERGTQATFRRETFRFTNSQEYDECNTIESDRFPKLCQLAEELVTRDDTAPIDRIAICRRLEAHFLRSGQYKYQLGRSPERRRDLDPVEDFVSNHKSGHCEYFASALALMLRSQGIPTRLVLGYKGGEYNSLGKYHVMRQLHAHAWVEAFLERDDAIQAGFSPEDAKFGAWMRLDPTPVSGGLGWELPGLAFLGRIHQWTDYMEVVWHQYVLGMNSERQLESVYQPIFDRIMQVGRSLTDPDAWDAFLLSLGSQLGISPAVVRRASAWFITALLMIVLTGVGSAIQMLRFLLQRWFGTRRPGEIPADVLPQVAFYAQMEQLLRKHGRKRVSQETPLEFAAAAAAQLAQQGHPPHVSSVPRAIVNAYYRVRYGQHRFSQDEEHQLMSLVKKLRQALHSGPRHAADPQPAEPHLAEEVAAAISAP